MTGVTASAPLASSGGTAPNITLGTVGVGNGGTGATTASAALSNLGAVPTTTTVNSHALSGNVTLTATDVSADAAGAAATAQTTAETFATTAANGAVTTAETYSSNANNLTTGKVLQSLLPSGVVYNNQANTYTAGTQTLAASSATGASLNVPSTGTAPTTPNPGDLWFATGATHPSFADNAGTARKLAYLNDISAANLSGTIAIANGGTAATTASAALSNLGGVPTTTTVNGHALSSNITLTATDVSADAAGAAATAQTNAELFATGAANGAVTTAETYSSIASNLTSGTVAQTLLPGDVVYNNQANTYGVGDKQTFVSNDATAGAAGVAGLNIAAAASSPQTVGAGDIWLTALDPHLQMQDSGNNAQKIAFLSDISAANVSGTVAIVNGGTGATTASAALSNLGGVPATTTVNGQALSGNVTLGASDVGADVAGAAATAQTNAELFATGAANGAVTTAETYSSIASNLTSGTVAQTLLPGDVVYNNQANTYGVGDKQTFVSNDATAGAAGVAGVNIAAAASSPQTVGAGDIWLTALDPHLQMQDSGNNAQKIAFLSDISAANVSGTVAIVNGGTGATTASAALSNLGGVPATTTVNGQALSGNVTLGASDVGADVAGAAATAQTNAELFATGAANGAVTTAETYSSIASNLTSGTVAQTLLPGDVVYNNQANTYGVGDKQTFVSNDATAGAAGVAGLNIAAAASSPQTVGAGDIWLTALDPHLQMQDSGNNAQKIAFLSDISAANVSGTVAIVNGGTGATTASAALSNLGGVPATTTVNGQALSGNVTLGASDVGADVAGAAATAQTNAELFATGAANGAVTTAETYSSIASNLTSGTVAQTLLPGDVVYNNQANTYGVGDKQTFVSNDATAGAAGVAGLNIAAAASSPQTVGAGDIWLTALDPHLQMQDSGNNAQKIAFLSDISAANVSGTVAIVNGGTGATTASAALSNLGGVPATTTVNGQALSGNVTLGASDVGADVAGAAATAQTNAELFATGAANGAVTTAETYSSIASNLTSGTVAQTLLPGDVVYNNQANTYGVGDKQTFVSNDATAGAAGVAGLNIAAAASSPQTVGAGDIWLTALDPHLQMQDSGNNAQKIAFLSDISAANVSGTVAIVNGGTGATTASAALSNLGGVPATTTVNGQALSGNVTLGASDVGADVAGAAATAQTNAELFATGAANGAVTTAETYSSIASNLTSGTVAQTLLPGDVVYNNQANTYGVGDKQTFVSNDATAGAAGVAGLNIAAAASSPQTVGAGDIWLTALDPHLQMQDSGNNAQKIAFLSDISAANVSGTVAIVNGGTGATTASAALSNLGGVPATTTVNGQALSGNVTLGASDVGADVAGAAATAQTNAELFATGAASTAQSNAETYASTTFLPLAGGTLTGGLTGTTGTFSGNVSAGGLTSSTLSLTGNASVSGSTTLAGTTVNGALSLPSLTGAASSASQPLQLAGSDSSNQPTLFQWLVNSGGALDLQTATSGGTPADSGLTIGSNGLISFATGQTFPGVSSSLTAGTGISSASLSSGTIAIDPSVVPQLGASSNTFTGSIAANSFSGLGTDLTGTASLLNIGGNAATATALAATPSGCTLPQVVTAISANGTPTCAEPSNITGSAASALVAGSATTFATALSGDVTGGANGGATTVVAINGSPLGTTTGASSGQALTWNGSAWVPANAAATAWSSLTNATAATHPQQRGHQQHTSPRMAPTPGQWAEPHGHEHGRGTNSPALHLSGEFFDGSSDAADTWTIQNSVATGTNGASTLTFGHSRQLRSIHGERAFLDRRRPQRQQRRLRAGRSGRRADRNFHRVRFGQRRSHRHGSDLGSAHRGSRKQRHRHGQPDR